MAGGVPATMPMCLPFSRASPSVVTSSRPLPWLGDQRVGGAVIGIGALDQVVALRIAHDDVATMRGERHPNEAGCLRKVRIVQLLLKLLGEQFGELVLEPLALLIRERQIARVGAYSQHLGIDELDRQIGAAITVCACGPVRYRPALRQSQPAQSSARDIVGICYRRLLHAWPADLGKLPTAIDGPKSGRSRNRQNAMLRNWQRATG